MDLDKVIQARKSVRKFKSKKPDWRAIIECIDAARYAPMAGGNYTLKFILVDDTEKIKKIAAAAQQDFIAQASYVVVACSTLSRTTNAFGERAKKYVKQQAGAGLQNFLLKIEKSGLSTCWVGHFVDAQIKTILTIPKEADVEAVFPIGFEYDKKKTLKAPIDLDSILYFNKYGEKKMRQPKKVDS